MMSHSQLQEHSGQQEHELHTHLVSAMKKQRIEQEAASKLERGILKKELMQLRVSGEALETHVKNLEREVYALGAKLAQQHNATAHASSTLPSATGELKSLQTSSGAPVAGLNAANARVDTVHNC
eukprot:Mycagemm_TRINITY_DN10909_c0_g1::TRINITY_DN10909_c0_g1_i1::g.405::m.405 type:complete len:125 gc:universal TRINITY_DN10909_c0_g1_i1:113-487(+)